MDELDFTFLTQEQIFGKNKLDVIREYGTKCAVTDFAILLGVRSLSGFGHYANYGRLGKEYTGYWWTMSSDGDGDAYLIDTDGANYIDFVTTQDGGGRPVLSYSKISSFCSNKVRNENGILVVEFGEYPQTIVSEKFALILESIYLKGKLKQTGKSYTIGNVNYIEYEYNGQKYIRFVADSNCVGKELSDGRIIKDGEVCWIEVESIKWMIDEKEDKALAKKILFSGVEFNKKNNYKDNFDETFIKKFMNKQFAKDIISINHHKKSINEDEMILIIDEINNYLEKYLGNNKKDLNNLVKEYIDRLVNDYNLKIKSIKNNNSLLTFENNDIEYHYSKLVMEFKDILDSLKGYFDNYKSSYEVIDIINNLINILNNNEYNNDNLTELDEYFITIKEVILPYIDNNQDVINKLNNILNNIKKDIINNISILELNDIKNDGRENKTKEELIFDLRKEIHPILIELSNLVRNKDIKNEIEKEYYNIMNNNYSESKNKLIGRYLNLINTLAMDIKNKTDNQEELEKLDEIINFNIDYSKDVNNIIKKLYQIINSLYGMLFDIDKRLEDDKKINQYLVNLDKVKKRIKY